MDDAKLFKLAKAGKIDDLLEAVGAGDIGDDDDEREDDEDGGSSEVDDAAYKWLMVAADFGHEEAAEMADDMLETSSLRYDDEGMSVGLIHLELGQAYLRGDAPLPIDRDKAKRHLAHAHRLNVHETTDVAKSFDAFRRKVDPEGRAIFDAVFTKKAAAKAAPKKKKKRATAPKAKKRR